MSETSVIGRDQTNGQFIKGYKGGARPKGARNKLGEAFLEDLRESWLRDGAEALRRCADEDPAAYCRVVAGLLPKDFNINVGVDVAAFADTFRAALEMLGNADAELPKRKPMRVINGR